MATCREGAVSAVHYDSYTEARAHLKDLLDAAERAAMTSSCANGLSVPRGDLAAADPQRSRVLLPDRAVAPSPSVISSTSTSRGSGHACTTVSNLIVEPLSRRPRPLPADVVYLL